ncbi:MAG: DUF4912 domain-containing protein [Candidatus Latescibacterota bacterium]|nr:MAG: DUF4912 domain-containing protein [Candidatus Latescibacterota bacterium]
MKFDSMCRMLEHSGKNQGATDMTPQELNKLTKLELVELARSNNLRATGLMTKAELIDLITAAERRKKLIAASVQKRVDAGDAAGKKAGKRPAAKSRSAKSVERAKAAAKKIVSGTAAKKSRVRAAKPPEPEKPASRKRSAPAPRAKAAGGKPPAAPAPAARKPAAPGKRPMEEEIRRMAEDGKYYLGAEQRIAPPVEAIDIPSGYNVDRIAALVRDPYWLFAYWEVTGHKYRELERVFGDTWPQCRMVLRVYDLSEARRKHFDITVTHEARNWYVNVSAERRYQIAIGALSPDGRFEQVAVSNVVETPSARVSDRVDEHWMVPDELFEKIFAASGGLDMHAASAELRELLERGLLEQVTSGSGGVSSFGSGVWPKGEKGRAFRLWVATELILYGGTEPDARVTVQGKEVKLRPDGTFSLRFALPDGKLDLPVAAASADGVEERTIETGVAKKSRAKEPVIK